MSLFRERTLTRRSTDAGRAWLRRDGEIAPYRIALVLLIATLSNPVVAAEKAFRLSGVPIVLEEVTDDVEVRYQSMRLNRALNVWNVEVTVTPKAGRTLRGPLLVSVDDFSGTSGPLSTDGMDEGAPAKPFYDLSNWVPQNQLGPGVASLPRTLSLGFLGGAAPRLTTRVYSTVAGRHAVALIRSLNEAGQPLPNVRVLETGPGGERTYETDGTLGLATLGGDSGAYVWKFQADDYLPVWRAFTLSSDSATEVALVHNPRLTRRQTNGVPVASAEGGQATSADRSIRLTFPANSLPQDDTVKLTPLTAQTLPALLPQGWSPLQAFWLELDGQPVAPVSASLRLAASLNSGEAAALVRLETNSVQWTVTQLIAGNGTNIIATTLPGPGAYAVVVGDVGTTAPPAAQVGQALQASGALPPDVRLLTAGGRVDPRTSAASRIAELVTAHASLAISNQSAPLASGLLLRGEVSEDYRLRDGTRRLPPRYEAFLSGYQRPGDNDPATLHAQFPVRPLMLLGPDELERATVTVDVLSPTAFNGAIVPPSGGQLVEGDVRIIVGTNGEPQGGAVEAAYIRRLNPTNFGNFLSGAATIERAFELTLTGGEMGRRIAARFSGLPTNSTFVLAKVVSRHGLTGLEPRERLVSNAQGNLVSAEPAQGETLPGIAGAGQYLLLRLTAPQALVIGVARNSAGEPTADLPVRVIGQPWLTFSAAAGAFRLLAPAGTNEIVISDVATGDTGQSMVIVSDPNATVLSDPSTTSVAPRVLSVNPTNTATRVARVTPIVIQFSEAINPGSLGSNGIQVLGTNDEPVTAGLTLNLQNTTVTLLPAVPLGASAAYEIVLSTNITDLTGLRLEGPNRFTFATETDALDRIQTAQVISYEPVNGRAAMTGSPGIAEPESPVILVNETTGRTSTILSRPDGSFTNSIEAGVDDFLSAVIVNQNGTRNTIPQSRQVFRDGSVGLFDAGGTIEEDGEDGTIQVLVEPGAVPNKTKLKLEPLSFSQVLTLVSNTQPEQGQGKVLGGFRFSLEGDALKQSADVSFPLPLERLELPAGVHPTNASYALAIAHNIDGETVYEIIDKMEYENGRLVTHSLPFLGLGLFALDFVPGVTTHYDIIHHMILTPILINFYERSLAVSGRVFSMDLNVAGTPIAGSEKFLPGARVTFSPLAQTVRAGRLRPGTVFATTGSDGKYATLLPRWAFQADGSTAIRATHPRFPGLVAKEIGAIPGLQENFDLLVGGIQPDWDLAFFVDAGVTGPDGAAPEVFVSHDPHHPPVGAPASIRIVTVDNETVPNVTVLLDSVTSLNPDIGGTQSGVTLQTVTNEVLGAATRRLVLSLNASNEVRVVLRIMSVDQAGNERLALHPVRLGGPPEPTEPGLTPSDTNDESPPSVVFSDPPNHARGVPPGRPVVLKFNEAIDRGFLQNLSVVQLAPTGTVSSVSLSPDQHELTLSFYDLLPDTDYTLTLGAGIKDISGNPLDQQPAISGANSFVLHFRTAPIVSGALTGIESGGGAVVRGNFAFVLERKGAMDGGVIVYDLSNPVAPQKASEFSLPGYPRDLALIPSYSFKRRTNGPAETKDLLAVMGGKLGELQVGQYLWILDISNPREPARLGAAAVNLNPSTAITKIKWSPPNLGYLETDVFSSIGIINLQTFILGTHFTQDEFVQLPVSGREGRDLNGDGDYVDLGEELPLPASRSPDVMGKVTAYGVPETDQFIRDFDMIDGGAVIGVALEAGNLYATDGTSSTNPVPAAYRTLTSNGSPLPREAASVSFSNALPARVHLLGGFPAQVNGDLTFVDLALVSLQAPPGGTNKLVVVNITEPLNPGIVTEIPIPRSHGDGIFGVIERDDALLEFPISAEFIASRNNWSLALATTRDLILIDPFKFFETSVTSHGLHPAIVGVIPDAGRGSQTISGALSGYLVGSQGARNQVFLAAPSLQFVNFSRNEVVRPEMLVDNPHLISLVFSNVTAAETLFPARFRAEGGAISTLSPPSPSDHYHVVIQAPGTSGATIPIALESLNRSGHLLRNKGRNFPPVRAVSETVLDAIGQDVENCDAPVRALTAYRLSSNPYHPHYNLYVSKPFALVYEKISLAELAQLTQELDREILWSGFYLRVSFDPSLNTNSVLGRFAAQIDRDNRLLVPGLSIMAESCPGTYIMGPNPPSVAGHVDVPGTFGTVSAHNGEFRSETVDMVLPGRRLPIEFVRTAIGQDLYEGPFGRSWDFTYNQQLNELRPTVFRQGSLKPLIIRSPENSEIARSRDIEFQDGEGRKILFKYAGTNVPPEYASDPLVIELGWLQKAQSYYLPQRGIFDLLVRFTDGKFARLTPNGMQYWYSDRGRLERIYDRYPENSTRFDYNLRGELVRITDESVSVDRFLELGYWRFASDSLFQPGLDSQTTNALVAGKICRLRDYTRRDVLFFYTEDGLLERREGPHITVAHAGGFTGRPVTRYLWDSACGDIKGIVAGSVDAHLSLRRHWTVREGSPW